MDPDKVFSTARYAPKKWEHCDVEQVFNYEDLVDFKVNESVVYWTTKKGFTPNARIKMKEYYMRKGDSEAEAQKKVEWQGSTKYRFQVKYVTIGTDHIYFDSMTTKVYKPPREEKYFMFFFADERKNFSLYIPYHGKAILTEYTVSDETSWVRLWFGKCRQVENKK